MIQLLSIQESPALTLKLHYTARLLWKAILLHQKLSTAAITDTSFMAYRRGSACMMVLGKEMLRSARVSDFTNHSLKAHLFQALKLVLTLQRFCVLPWRPRSMARSSSVDTPLYQKHSTAARKATSWLVSCWGSAWPMAAGLETLLPVNY